MTNHKLQIKLKSQFSKLEIVLNFKFVFSYLFVFCLLLFGFSNQAFALVCNDQADGNWNSTATWSCGVVPDADDDVTIDSHTVTMTADSLSNTVTINGGTLNMGSYTHTNDSGWTYTSGAVDAGTGTVKFVHGGSAYTITPGSVDYYNWEFNNNSVVLTIDGSANINNDLILTKYYIFSGGEMHVKNDIQIIGGNYGGTTYIYIDGTDSQSIISSGGSLPNIVINKSSGVLSLFGTIGLYDNWTWQAGQIEAGNSTLKFVGNHTASFTGGSVEYYNLEFDIATTTTKTISGNATVANDVILTNYYILNGDTINVKGDVSILAGSYGGSATIEINGANDQTLSSSGGILPNIKINKNSGFFYLSGMINIRNNWTWQAGQIEAGASTLNFVLNSTQTFTPGDVYYYNIKVDKTAGAYTASLAGNLKVTNELAVDSGVFSTSSSNYTITTKDFIQTGGTMDMNAGAIKVTGGFTRTGGTFSYDTSVVSFLGENQTIDVTGFPTTFYKLYKLTNSADTLTITAGNTLTIATGGVMRFWGKPEGKTLSVVSSSPGTPYTITRTGTAELEYTDWSDASWSAAQTAAASSLGTGNTNLTVTKEFISTIRATGGDYSTLSSWEAAVQTDLTASTTKVFSHGGITGAIADIDTVTGVTSGATASVVHATTTQILLETISGTFQSGEQVQVDASNHVTISDAGFGAIATAHPYNDWPTGLSDRVSFSGWTTDSTRYLAVYVPLSQRHNGWTWTNTSKNVYSGFALKLNADYNNALTINENYTRINGLIVYSNAYDYGYIGIKGDSSGDYSIISNNIVYGFHSTSSLRVGIVGGWYSNNVKTFNNLVYDSDIGYIVEYATGAYFYNNSSLDNYKYGFNTTYTSLNYGVLKNNIAYSNTTTDYKANSGTAFTSVNYSASSDATSDDWNGTGNRINQTFAFVDEANDDFHLSAGDQGAKGYGTDLSIDPNFPIIDDIDGQTRPVWESWDIGADQTARKIYRSVGPSNTSALAVGTSNALNIASETAIFASALPDNVGVGDAIQYDSDNNGTIDSIAFIAERYSSTSYKIQNSNGFTPNQLSTADNDWSIFRAYASLANAESGTENTGIDNAVEQFDSAWSSSGGRDLTVDDVQWNIACYGDAEDATAVTVDGWTTSAQNFLKIYTPVDEDEVGEKQRHSGVWDDEKYHLRKTMTGNYSNLLSIKDEYVWVDGLQVYLINNAYTSDHGISISVDNSTSDVKISNNIVRGSISGTGTNCTGIILYNVKVSAKIWNNVAYGFTQGTISRGFSIFPATDAGIPYVYNNTAYGNLQGLHYYAFQQDVVIKNNLSVNNSQDFVNGGTGTVISSNNLSSDATSPNSGATDCGGHSCRSQTVLFLDEARYDFHLNLRDTAALGAGINLTDDSYLSFSDDIDGQERLSVWDIGADGTFLPKFEIRGNAQFRGNIKMR